MDVFPTGLQKIEDGRQLRIEWSDGHTQEIPAKTLRNACPCATCFEKELGKKKEAAAGGKKSLTILSSQELQPMAVLSMKPAGGYAYQISFSDGHSTGLYSLDLIRNLSS